jgi:uncharacterized protein (DUF2141 family)
MRLAIIAILTLLSSATAAAASLSVQVKDVQGREGEIVVRLFASADEFPTGAGVAEAAGPAADGAILRLDGIAPGTYALIAIHDRNGDGKMEKNFLGLPLEGYGLSTNPQPLLVPRFNDGKFQITDGENRIEVRLVYY